MKTFKKLIPWILFVAVIVGLVMWSKQLQKGPTDGRYDEFAQCVTDQGFTMYGAYWCPHCKAEKARFGTSFEKIKYVECTEETQRCLDMKIESYPTWIQSSSTATTSERFVGELGLERLAEISSCNLPVEVK